MSAHKNQAMAAWYSTGEMCDHCGIKPNATACCHYDGSKWHNLCSSCYNYVCTTGMNTLPPKSLLRTREIMPYATKDELRWEIDRLRKAREER